MMWGTAARKRNYLAAFTLLGVCISVWLKGPPKNVHLHSWVKLSHHTVIPVNHGRASRNIISVGVFYFPFHRDNPNMTEKVLAYQKLDLREPTQYLNRYFTPLVNVILNWNWLLPDWTVRVYISQGHPFIPQLRKLGAEVVEMHFDPNRWARATTWRFLVEDDPHIRFWASREAESPPTFQDAAVLKHWTKETNFKMHSVQVHPAHHTWNAGSWGAMRGHLSAMLNITMAEAIERYQENIDNSGRLFGSVYGDDQFFMADEINPVSRMKEVAIAYQNDAVRSLNRTFCHYKDCAPLPPYPGRPEQDFRPSMNHVGEDEAILCHHPDPPYCRMHKFAGVKAWRMLYELCTGEDLFTQAPIAYQSAYRSPDELHECPYRSVQSSATWIKSLQR